MKLCMIPNNLCKGSTLQPSRGEINLKYKSVHPEVATKF